MAKSTHSRSILYGALECSICQEVFDTPVSLPCLHTFCVRCIEHYIKSLHLNPNPSRADKRKLTCPICRCRFMPATGGVVNLPKNFVIKNIKDALVTLEKKESDLLFKSINNTVADINLCIRDKSKTLHSLQEIHNNLSKTTIGVLKEIEKSESHFLQSVLQHIHTMKMDVKSANETSLQTLQYYLDKMQSDIQSLQNTADLGDDMIKLGVHADARNLCTVLSDTLKAHKPTVYDIKQIKSSLNRVSFKAGCLDNFDPTKVIGFCEKQSVSIEDVRQNNDENSQASTSDNETQPEPAILTQIKHISTLQAGKRVWSVVMTSSCDAVVTNLSEGVVIYTEDKEERVPASAPTDASIWCPCDVTLTSRTRNCSSVPFNQSFKVLDEEKGSVVFDGDENVFITNFASAENGGGVYLLEGNGTMSLKIKLDHPWSITSCDQCHLAVLTWDEKNKGRVDVYCMDSLEMTSTSRIDADVIPSPRHVTVNNVTRDIIVTHLNGVTAFAYPNLCLRWLRQSWADYEFRNPQGVCCDKWGRILVADYGSRHVVILNSDGGYLTHLGTDHYMDYPPFAIALNQKGQLVIASIDITGDKSSHLHTVDYVDTSIGGI